VVEKTGSSPRMAVAGCWLWWLLVLWGRRVQGGRGGEDARVPGCQDAACSQGASLSGITTRIFPLFGSVFSCQIRTAAPHVQMLSLAALAALLYPTAP
jgi:hypothetical protein